MNRWKWNWNWIPRMTQISEIRDYSSITNIFSLHFWFRTEVFWTFSSHQAHTDTTDFHSSFFFVDVFVNVCVFIFVSAYVQDVVYIEWTFWFFCCCFFALFLVGKYLCSNDTDDVFMTEWTLFPFDLITYFFIQQLPVDLNACVFYFHLTRFHCQSLRKILFIFSCCEWAENKCLFYSFCFQQKH